MTAASETTVKENKAPATTSPVDFIVPNQDLFEKVIDLRLAAHANAEKPAAKTSRTTAVPNKDTDKS
jgi:hypothetical protein